MRRALHGAIVPARRPDTTLWRPAHAGTNCWFVAYAHNGCIDAGFSARQVDAGQQVRGGGRILQGPHAVHGATVDVRRQHLDEVVHVAAHQRGAAQADPRGERRKEMARVEAHEVRIGLRLVRHAGDDSGAEVSLT